MVEIKYGQKVVNPEMGQKVRFGNEDGHEIDKVLIIWPENGSRHTNFFMRIEPKTLEFQIVEDLSRSKPHNVPP